MRAGGDGAVLEDAQRGLVARVAERVCGTNVAYSDI